jgi:hypothetical protein
MNTVIIGAPLSGKTTCIHSLARSLNGVVERRKLLVPNHTPEFERAIGFTVHRKGAEQAFWTLPANVWWPEAWDQLIRESDHVILVLDTHAVRGGPNAEAIARLRAAGLPPRSGRVVLTKIDIVGEAEAWRQREELLRGTEQADWPTFVHTQKTSDVARARDLVPGFV